MRKRERPTAACWRMSRFDEIEVALQATPALCDPEQVGRISATVSISHRRTTTDRIGRGGVSSQGARGSSAQKKWRGQSRRRAGSEHCEARRQRDGATQSSGSAQRFFMRRGGQAVAYFCHIRFADPINSPILRPTVRLRSSGLSLSRPFSSRSTLSRCIGLSAYTRSANMDIAPFARNRKRFMGAVARIERASGVGHAARPRRPEPSPRLAIRCRDCWRLSSAC